MKKIAILGAGMVGSAIARDLSFEHQVMIYDIDETQIEKALAEYGLKGNVCDLSFPGELKKAISDASLVICAVPGFMGFETLRTCIDYGKDVVDVSFALEDPFELDELACKRGVTAVVDMGVAPGMSNLILGYYDSIMNVQRYECMVGGLPIERKHPFEYKAPFSPIDVIEEYIRPARIVENGVIINKEALSEAEFFHFEGIGTLEAFNTDGLRTLLSTMKIPNMKEKTLRYPGHKDKIRILRDTGFFSHEPIQIANSSIKPIELTTKLLFDMWKLKENEREFTVMHIDISGVKDGNKKSIRYEMIDYFNPETGISSMARTTGYAAAGAAEAILEGIYSRKGISPPEFLGKDKKVFDKMMTFLEKRNIIYRKMEC